MRLFTIISIYFLIYGSALGQSIDSNIGHFPGNSASMNINGESDLVSQAGNAELYLTRSNNQSDAAVRFYIPDFLGSSFSNEYWNFGLIDNNDNLSFSRRTISGSFEDRQALVLIDGGVSNDPAVLIPEDIDLRFGDTTNWSTIKGNGSGLEIDALSFLIPSFSELRFGTSLGGSTIKGNGLSMEISTPILTPELDDFTNLGSSSLRYKNVYSAGGVTTTSDERLKKNISAINYGINELVQLIPVRYNWKNDKDTSEQIGLLAQELLKVIPEAVVSTESVIQEDGTIIEEEAGTYGIKYHTLIPVLIQGIKDQQLEIEKMKIKIVDLERKLEKI